MDRRGVPREPGDTDTPAPVLNQSQPDDGFVISGLLVEHLVRFALAAWLIALDRSSKLPDLLVRWRKVRIQNRALFVVLGSLVAVLTSPMKTVVLMAS